MSASLQLPRANPARRLGQWSIGITAFALAFLDEVAATVTVTLTPAATSAVGQRSLPHALWSNPGATSAITSSIQFFRDEFVAHQTSGGCPLDPMEATLFAGALAQ